MWLVFLSRIQVLCSITLLFLDFQDYFVVYVHNKNTTDYFIRPKRIQFNHITTQSKSINYKCENIHGIEIQQRHQGLCIYVYMYSKARQYATLEIKVIVTQLENDVKVIVLAVRIRNTHVCKKKGQKQKKKYIYDIYIKNAKTTATSIPMWSPTIVLTDLDTV